MEKALKLSESDLANNIEINFEQLSKSTNINNFIIEYHMEYNNYFKRSLFELDRLNLNIGILVCSDGFDIELLIKDLINNIKGFKINLGIWINFDSIDDIELYKRLSNTYQDNFITGIRDMANKTMINAPIWNINGDISEYGIKLFDTSSKTEYKEIELISDYKSIYNENNMKPIPSTYKI